MKMTIEVTNRREAELIRAGLADAQTRAVVTIVGALSLLPSSRAKARVLEFVSDALDEDSVKTNGEQPCASA